MWAIEKERRQLTGVGRVQISLTTTFDLKEIILSEVECGSGTS
jgi:hypothetical protein